MTWTGGCQGDRRCECTYLTFDTFEEFCIDSDVCWDVYDNGGLIGEKCKNEVGGGGGW